MCSKPPASSSVGISFWSLPCLFWDEVMLCSPWWTQLLVLLPLVLEFWDYHHGSPQQPQSVSIRDRLQGQKGQLTCWRPENHSHAWRSYPKLAITYFGDLVFLLLTLYSLSLNYLEAWCISQKSVLIILFIVVWSHFWVQKSKGILSPTVPYPVFP